MARPHLSIYLAQDAQPYLDRLDEIVTEVGAANRSDLIRGLCEGRYLVVPNTTATLDELRAQQNRLERTIRDWQA